MDSVSEIWGPLIKGVKSVILPKKSTQNVDKFVETLEEFGITRFFGVTSLVRSILAYFDMEKDRIAPSKRLRKAWEVCGFSKWLRNKFKVNGYPGIELRILTSALYRVMQGRRYDQKRSNWWLFCKNDWATASWKWPLRYFFPIQNKISTVGVIFGRL